MTQKAVQQSGTSKPPQAVLPYPKLLSDPAIARDVYCYVIKHYGNVGLSVLIDRTTDISVRFGDWNGNVVDMASKTPESDRANRFITNGLRLFASVMKSINLTNAQFFLADVNNDLVLTDIQLSLNKLCGPGMVRDIFGNVFSTQEILKTEIIDDRATDAIIHGSGTYAGNLILKPSKFRLYHNQANNTYVPLYVEVLR